MKKILVVEDNEKNMYLMRFLLQKMGHQVLEAGDGATGVALAIQELPDLILMDIQLPVLDGYAATKQIRSNETTSGIPIVAITSFAMVGDREKTLDAGCTEYIEKPIDPTRFMSQIERFL